MMRMMKLKLKLPLYLMKTIQIIVQSQTVHQNSTQIVTETLMMMTMLMMKELER